MDIADYANMGGNVQGRDARRAPSGGQRETDVSIMTMHVMPGITSCSTTYKRVETWSRGLTLIPGSRMLCLRTTAEGR